MKKYLFFFFLFLMSKLFATTDNIAPLAEISTSSTLNDQFDKSKLVDGLIGIDGIGEWACKGYSTSWGYIENPWVKFEWNSSVMIDRIVLYDRPNLFDNVAGVKILFSDSTSSNVFQLSPDGEGKSIEFSPKKVKWIKIQVTDGTGKDLGFSEIEIYNAKQSAIDKVSLVDPYIETNRGRYFFFITGSLPFGMATSAPMTRNKNQYGGGYNFNEKEILGFEQVHSWMMSGIEIMPATTKEDIAIGQNGWKSRYNHDDEIVQPGYHRVMLQNNKIWVEQTCTERVNFYRFRYTKKSDARIIINLYGLVGNCLMKNAKVKKVSDNQIEGSVSTVDRFWGGPIDVKVFFVIQFDKPFKFNVWDNGEIVPDSNNIFQGEKLCLGAEYKMNKADTLKMKVAISYTSEENAHVNLDRELNHWNFDTVRNNARNIWNNWLGKIEVKGGTIDQRVKFYTDLWHVLLGRQKINDINGYYPDRTQGKRIGNFTDAVFKIKRLPMEGNKVRFNMYNNDAWWLSQWNLNVLWGLAWPEIQDEMSASMIEYANNGNLLPRGPCGGGYSYIMTSCPASNLIISTYMKGLLTKQDPNHAFDVIKRNHMPGGMLGKKEDVEFYIKKGWWPENAGIGIEAAFQDWGISQMAYKLNKFDDYKYFKKRSRNWEPNFSSEIQLLLPKDRNGRFIHKDPLSNVGWVESNSWQASWGVSHDIYRLIELMGGEENFCKKLNYAFSQSEKDDFVYSYSNGYISYANQPGCSDAHVFSYARKPWLTQYWVRKVKQQAYGGTTPDLGYGGHDEDQGQMSAIDVLMSIGLFNILGTESIKPFYEITSPIFDEIIIKLDNNYYQGDRFIIKTHNNNRDNVYINKASFNGNVLNRFWITHDDFQKGGIMELWLDKVPNYNWGTNELPKIQ